MPGGIFQLKANGIQDSFFVSESGKNFIKQTHVKHTNFSKELIELRPKEHVDFGKNFSIEFPRFGDYINNVYLDFKLPALTHTSGTFAGWTNSIGHVLIKKVEIEIGGYTLDTNYGIFLEIWEELTNKQRFNDNKLIGKFGHVTLLKFNALQESEYSVPLKFWFSNSIQDALPVFALKYNTIKLNFSLESFENCVVFDGVTPPEPVSITSAVVSTEYLFIDENTREILANTELSFVITQIQSVINENIRNPWGYTMNLPFNHPCSELIFVLREEDSEENNDWFNFAIRNPDVNAVLSSPITSAKLILDGTDRFGEISSKTLNQKNIRRYHTNDTDKFIYCIPFGEYPESNMPNGSMNFSLINNTLLYLTLNENCRPSNAFVFAKNFNILNIRDGQAYIAFSS
jgi:hypothetical protein